MAQPRRPGPFNPLRNEADAFRVLVYGVAVIAAIVAVVLLIQALT